MVVQLLLIDVVICVPLFMVDNLKNASQQKENFKCKMTWIYNFDSIVFIKMSNNTSFANAFNFIQ